MARLTKEEHDKILESISEGVNASPEVMDFISRLRSDFDESLSVDLDEARRDWEDRYNTAVSERDRAIGERDEARRAYRQRFFSNAQEEAEKIVSRQKDDSPKGTDYVLGISRQEEI